MLPLSEVVTGYLAFPQVADFRVDLSPPQQLTSPRGPPQWLHRMDVRIAPLSPASNGAARPAQLTLYGPEEVIEKKILNASQLLDFVQRLDSKCQTHVTGVTWAHWLLPMGVLPNYSLAHRMSNSILR